MLCMEGTRQLTFCRMLDAVMYRLYGTFATNQTGNTVFLTLAALHWGTSKLILAIASLGGFFGAGLIMGQLGARFGESLLH